jgi:hypothetical protein
VYFFKYDWLPIYDENIIP